MNTNYSEALERQVAALRLITIPGFAERWGSNWKDRTPSTSRQEMALLAQRLARADTVYIGRDIAATLGEVVQSEMPEWTLREEHLITSNGWCWFAANPGYRDETDAAAVLRAMSWGLLWVNQLRDLEHGQRLMSFTNDAPEPGAVRSIRTLILHPWYSHRDHLSMFGPWTPLVWPVGSSNTVVNEITMTGEPLSEQARRDMRFEGRLFAALMCFLGQRIFVTSTERAERHARRRLEAQGWTHEPLIRVVQLRRTERSGYQSHEGTEPVDWSCQWVVRGHWRQQWFPSKKANAPIWITPYVKGPEDKPLKAPRTTVFAVVR